MLLTRLEIKGFKSFADKVVVNFDHGITGVVGPNGCGKSNIVDSIRWVLGEQKTRALRSEKMENIIFNGTKKRKQLQMSEVSLTFKNTKNLLPTEYSEVTISRRYYRSGDGEYLLNGVPCRLKDITNLFMDTGIGSDSYAIIELKMVDDILNDKDNSRRTLFEEAAGISKFKVRKKQTLKKLDDTGKDLERVDDLLFEIEKNLKSLERQAKQAEKYLQLKDDYKKFSVDLARFKSEKQTEGFNKLNKQIEKETDEKEKLNASLKKKESDLEKLKATLVSKEKLLSSRQKTLNEFVNQLRQYESDKRIKNERLRFLNDKVVSLQEQISQDKISIEKASTDLHSLQDQKVNAEKMLKEIELKTNTFKEEQEDQKQRTVSLQEQLNVVQKSYQEKREEVYQLKKSLEISEVQLEKLQSDLEKTSQDSSANYITVNDLLEELNSYAKQLKEKTAVVDQLVDEENKLNIRINETSIDIDGIREELAKLNREIDSKENEYNLTKSMVDNLEGYPDAIKFLKKNSAWAVDSHLLSDVMTTSEEYRIAIESYLEPVINYYVVDDYAQAYQAVNMLSDASKGKANFFVLNSFDEFKSKKNQVFENCVKAIDIVEYDDKYAQLVHFILDGVYIQVDNREELPSEEGYTFITQNGKLTKKHHSLTGGSVGLFEGKKIGRIKNLQKLQKKIKELTTKRDQVKSSHEQKLTLLTSLKESTKVNAIEEGKRELTALNESYISTKIRHEQLSNVIDSDKSKKIDIQQNIKILQDALDKSKPKLDLELVELQNLEDKINQLKNELEYQSELLTQKSSAFNQENIHFHQQRNRVESIDQEIEFKNNNLDNAKTRLERAQGELGATNDEIKKLIDTAEVDDDDLVEKYKEKESIELGVNEAEKDYYASRGSIDNIEEEIREVRRKRENIDATIAELKNAHNESKLQLTAIKERLKVEFNVQLDQLIIEDEKKEKVFQIKLTEQELTSEVLNCKERLDKIGPINPMAMEAYQEIKERHDFIVEQKNDLEEAKKSLLDTILEIDTVAKENFLEAFNSIRENFINVFRTLFTDEDKCDLKLSDPSKPLESSIEITAQPKGKRPLSINQLSGGEKTLTAVALLFAIYLIKPAPFCIFDEVDAPLDDANIDKFNSIIKRFSKESQFIIVTHNKRTMASTDVIYGVTMQETGVSKLVPVDLRDLPDEL